MSSLWRGYKTCTYTNIINGVHFYSLRIVQRTRLWYVLTIQRTRRLTAFCKLIRQTVSSAKNRHCKAETFIFRFTHRIWNVYITYETHVLYDRRPLYSRTVWLALCSARTLKCAASTGKEISLAHCWIQNITYLIKSWKNVFEIERTEIKINTGMNSICLRSYEIIYY